MCLRSSASTPLTQGIRFDSFVQPFLCRWVRLLLTRQPKIGQLNASLAETVSILPGCYERLSSNLRVLQSMVADLVRW